MRNNIQLTENIEDESEHNANFNVELFHNPDVQIASQVQNNNNWQMNFHLHNSW